MARQHPQVKLLQNFLKLDPISRCKTKEVYEAAKLLVPYHISPAGGDKFIILNRLYKPLGIYEQLGDFVDYETLPDNLKITREQARMLALYVPSDWKGRWPGYMYHKENARSSVNVVEATLGVLYHGQ